MSNNKNIVEGAEHAPERLATRRRFLKSIAATGAVTAMYAVPKLVTVHAKRAYAAITGASESVVDSREETVITFEEGAGLELAPDSGKGTHWQESGFDVKALRHCHRAFDGVSMALNIHADYPNSDGFEITCVTGGKFSISSVDITLERGDAIISSDKGGSITLSPGTNNLSGSDWSEVSKVIIVSYNHPSTPVWVDNISVNKP